LLILLATMAAFVQRLTSIAVTDALHRLIRDHAPDATKELLSSVVDQSVARVSGSGASIGVAVTAVVALWSGSNAVGSLLRAFNRAYGVEETRSFFQRTRLKLILTLLITISINLAFIAIVFGHRVGAKVADELDYGGRF